MNAAMKPWHHSASMPQGSLADERDKSVVRASLVSRRNASRNDNYHRSGVIAANPVRQNKQEALPGQEASSRSGKYMPLISYDASIGINKKAKTSSKNKCSRMTRGSHVTRATLAARTAQASRPAASGTPSPDNKTSASDNNNSNTILFWWDS